MWMAHAHVPSTCAIHRCPCAMGNGVTYLLNHPHNPIPKPNPIPNPNPNPNANLNPDATSADRQISFLPEPRKVLYSIVRRRYYAV